MAWTVCTAAASRRKSILLTQMLTVSVNDSPLIRLCIASIRVASVSSCLCLCALLRSHLLRAYSELRELHNRKRVVRALAVHNSCECELCLAQANAENAV